VRIAVTRANRCELLRFRGLGNASEMLLRHTVVLLQVYMVPLDMRLGREQLTNILRTGHSRIPVHEPGSPQEVVGLLLVKELVLLDPDDEVRPRARSRAAQCHVMKGAALRQACRP